MSEDLKRLRALYQHARRQLLDEGLDSIGWDVNAYITALEKNIRSSSERDKAIARAAFEAARAFNYERDESGQYDLPQDEFFQTADDYLNSEEFKELSGAKSLSEIVK